MANKTFWGTVLFFGALLWMTVQVQALRQVNKPPYAFDGTFRRIHVPILMYHYVSPLPVDADAYRIDLTVEPEIFRAHMAFLHEQGYETISLYALHEALTEGVALSPKPIVLTFDDGYLDHYQYVFPVLQEYGFVGTFFIITGKADADDPAYLSWRQVREMSDAGMDMESHTKSHIDLRGREHDLLVYEILGSIESLEAHTGKRIRMFCYPAGRYDESVLTMLATTPVLRAVTTQPGAFHTTDNVLELSRLRVSGNLSIGGLEHLLVNGR